jgi:hypothetical protein
MAKTKQLQDTTTTTPCTAAEVEAWLGHLLTDRPFLRGVTFDMTPEQVRALEAGEVTSDDSELSFESEHAGTVGGKELTAKLATGPNFIDGKIDDITADLTFFDSDGIDAQAVASQVHAALQERWTRAFGSPTRIEEKPYKRGWVEVRWDQSKTERRLVKAERRPDGEGIWSVRAYCLGGWDGDE